MQAHRGQKNSANRERKIQPKGAAHSPPMKSPDEGRQRDGTHGEKQPSRIVKGPTPKCDGTDRKNKPFRYWLPQNEAEWKKNPLYGVFERQEEELGVSFAAMRAAMDKMDEPTKRSRGRRLPRDAEEE